MELRRPKSKPDAKGSARALALRLLARREHTRRELALKLAPHVDDPAELDRLLDDLAVRGWLSDARAVEQLVRSKRERVGAASIRRALLARGVSEELIAAALRDLEGTELERAHRIWARKFPEGAATTADRARQVRFLQRRGFTLEIAMRLVSASSRSRPGSFRQERDAIEVTEPSD